MTGYELSRTYFAWASDNLDKRSPGLLSLYSYFVDEWNHQGQPAKFEIDTRNAVTLIGMNDKTFGKYLDQLDLFGLVQIVRHSSNQYTRWILSFPDPAVRTKPDSALTRARRYRPTEPEPATEPEKPKPQKKQKTPAKARKVAPEKTSVQTNGYTLVHRMRLLVEEISEGYYWRGKDGKAAEQIITFMRHKWPRNGNKEPATDDDYLNTFRHVITNLPEFWQDKWDMVKIAGDFESITKQIKAQNGKPTPKNQQERNYDLAADAAKHLVALYGQPDTDQAH